MKHIIAIPILLLLLGFGAYSTRVAEKRNEQTKLEKNNADNMLKRLHASDHIFLRTAQNIGELSNQNYKDSPSGSIVVKDGVVIGKGWVESDVLTDSAAHPEMRAVSEASKYLRSTSLKGCVIYSSTQPCPLCLSLLYMTDVDKIIYTISLDKENQTELQGINQRVYQSIMKNQSERYDREVVMSIKDYE